MDALLPSKRDVDRRTKPFFSGGIMVVRRVGVGQDRRTLIWFRLKKWFFIYAQVLCEIVSSFKVEGLLFCKILSRLLLITDILSPCRLCFWAVGRVVFSEAGLQNMELGHWPSQTSLLSKRYQYIQAVATWKKQSAQKSLSASSLAGSTSFQILSLRNWTHQTRPAGWFW